MSEMFSISFDQRSLSEIAMFYGFETLLQPEVQEAMQQAGDLLTQAAQANTWNVFDNPTGALAGSITPLQDSPYEVQVGVGVPYGARREFGYSGMTDSLGRYYANDPAKPYLTPALEDNQQQVLQLIEDAVQRAFARMGAS